MPAKRVQGRDETHVEQQVEGVRVEGRLDLRVREHGLDLGAEDQLPSVPAIEQRLDPHRVAGQEEPPPGRVVEGEGEHPVEPLDEGVPCSS